VQTWRDRPYAPEQALSLSASQVGAVVFSHTLDTTVEHLCEVADEQARDLDLPAPGEAAGLVTDWKARVERT